MANKIVLKKSSVGARVPATGDLDYGELAINYTDGKIYYKNSSNDIDFFRAPSKGVFSTPKSITVTSGTTNIDFSQADHFHLLMQSSTTITISNAGSKIGCSGNIIIKQDATGGRTFTKPSEMKTPIGGAAIDQSTDANVISVLSYYIVDANTILVNYIGDFA
jgi:hypothetical protein